MRNIKKCDCFYLSILTAETAILLVNTPVVAIPNQPQVMVRSLGVNDDEILAMVVAASGSSGAVIDPLVAEVEVLQSERGQMGHRRIAHFEGGVEDDSNGTVTRISAGEHPESIVILVPAQGDVSTLTWRKMAPFVVAIMRGLRPEVRVAVLAYGDSTSILRCDSSGACEFELIGNEGCDHQAKVDPADRFLRLAEAAEIMQRPGIIPGPQGVFVRLFGMDEDPIVVERAIESGDYPMWTGERDVLGESNVPGALDLAVDILLTEPAPLRELILISDGRDGYLNLDDQVLKQSIAKCSSVTGTCAFEDDDYSTEYVGRSNGCNAGTLACMADKLSEVLEEREYLVREKISALIAKLVDAHTVIDAVAIPGTAALGARRLEVLSLGTGGSFREVGVDWEAVATDMASGFAGRALIEVEDVHAEGSSLVRVSMRAGRSVGGRVLSQTVPIRKRPGRGAGLLGEVNELNSKAISVFGAVAGEWVFRLGLGVFALILLWVMFLLFRAVGRRLILSR